MMVGRKTGSELKETLQLKNINFITTGVSKSQNVEYIGDGVAGETNSSDIGLGITDRTPNLLPVKLSLS